jgi:hypothetical protein
VTTAHETRNALTRANTGYAGWLLYRHSRSVPEFRDSTERLARPPSRSGFNIRALNLTPRDAVSGHAIALLARRRVLTRSLLRIAAFSVAVGLAFWYVLSSSTYSEKALFNGARSFTIQYTSSGSNRERFDSVIAASALSPCRPYLWYPQTEPADPLIIFLIFGLQPVLSHVVQTRIG